MKQLTCEMCGSTDLMKQDGVFVCQTCGTKYSVEEAKKMMIEGDVHVTGTVKIDTSDSLKNNLTNAQNSIKQKNWVDAERYYSLVKDSDPTNAESFFYVPYARVMQAISEQNFKKATAHLTELENTLPTLLVESSSVDELEQKKINQIVGDLKLIDQYHSENYHHSINTPIEVVTDSNAFSKRTASLLDKCYRCLSEIIVYYKRDYNDERVKFISDKIIELNQYLNTYFTEYFDIHHNLRIKYILAEHNALHACDPNHIVPNIEPQTTQTITETMSNEKMLGIGCAIFILVAFIVGIIVSFATR